MPPCPEDQTQRYHNCFGTYTYTGGQRYVGEFKDDMRNGHGTYTYADGRVEKGIFTNGEFKYAKKTPSNTPVSPATTKTTKDKSKKSNAGDLTTRLKKLKELEDQGLITKEEAARKRKEILEFL